MRAVSFSRASLVLLHFLFFSMSQSQCFHPNGTETTDAFHAPCSNDTASPLAHVCCAWQRPIPFGADGTQGFTADKCLSNGLCQNNAMDENRNVRTEYWREECTEQGWKEGACPTFCINGSDGIGNVRMTPCDGTSTSERWCCGDSISCCGVDNNVNLQIVAATLGAPTTTAISSLPLPSASSTSIIPTSSTTNVPSAASSSELSTGAKAGIGVCAAVGAIGLFIAGYFFARRKGAHRAQPDDKPYTDTVFYARMEEKFAPLGEMEAKSVQPVSVHELSADKYDSRIRGQSDSAGRPSDMA
ncbi:hypothetical protein EJ04DRAFT_95922 [Polyplosphaeria fusca]|uniref:Uncharacterized protein n=1 Tax=Polyplosphaeria fusca TaxID=682080 RepID=A0A9P4V2S7_9PLEO|nr:hypothetical protein EJ04DRAFT_95922 [Polyplosphaeria fusca]